MQGMRVLAGCGGRGKVERVVGKVSVCEEDFFGSSGDAWVSVLCASSRRSAQKSASFEADVS